MRLTRKTFRGRVGREYTTLCCTSLCRRLLAFLGAALISSDILRFFSTRSPRSIRHPHYRRTRRMLDRDALGPAEAVREVAPLRHDALQPHAAGVLETQLTMIVQVFTKVDAVPRRPAYRKTCRGLSCCASSLRAGAHALQVALGLQPVRLRGEPFFISRLRDSWN